MGLWKGVHDHVLNIPQFGVLSRQVLQVFAYTNDEGVLYGWG